MGKSIADLRAAFNASLDALALTYGENTELDQSEQNDVSYRCDTDNETWNDTLGTRPH